MMTLAFGPGKCHREGCGLTPMAVLGCRNRSNKKDREGGSYYERMLQAAEATNPTIVAITSYNEVRLPPLLTPFPFLVVV